MSTKKDWFVVNERGREGPYTNQELRQLVKNGKVRPNSTLYEGMSDKLCEANQVTGLFDGLRLSNPLIKETKTLNNSSDTSAEPEAVHPSKSGSRSLIGLQRMPWLLVAVMLMLAVGVTIGVFRMIRIQSQIESTLEQITARDAEIEVERQQLAQSLKEDERLQAAVNDQIRKLNAIVDDVKNQRTEVGQLQQEFETQVALNTATLKALDTNLATIQQKSAELAVAGREQERKENDEAAAKVIAFKQKLSEEAQIALVRYAQQQVPQKQRLLSAATQAFGLVVLHWRNGTLTKREGKETMTQLRRAIPLVQGIEEIISIGGDIEVQSTDGKTATFRDIWKEANKF